MTRLSLGGRTIELSSLDKVLWPGGGFRKRDMLDYYLSVADVLVPHLEGRPLTLGRWPTGIEGRGFAQNECRGRPAWMSVQPLRLRTGETRNYCVVDDAASLPWVVNQSTIELHPYLARGDREEPTFVVFDLDPPPGKGVVAAAKVALSLREVLTELGLACFAKTSGSRGVHVYVPLGGRYRYGRAKAFARQIAERLAGRQPGEATAGLGRREREGKLLIDSLQNDPRRSTVAAYSLRATDRPSVSTPVAWEEIAMAAARGRPELLAFSPAAALARVRDLGDLFRPVLELRQALPEEPC